MLIPEVEIDNFARLSDLAVLSLLKELCYCSDCSLTASQDLVSGASDEVLKKCNLVFRRLPCRVGILDAKDDTMVKKWLDNGAKRVIVSGAAESLVKLGEQLPTERLIGIFELDEADSLKDDQIAALMGSLSSVIVKVDTSVQRFNRIDGLITLAKRLTERFGAGRFSLKLSALPSEWNSSDRTRLVRELHYLSGKGDFPVHVESVLMCLGGMNCSEINSNQTSQGLSVAESFLACLVTDRHDGLYTTVVCDELGIALGLVYSSDESICASLTSGRGVFWSRSRQQLWKKGETSGMIQELISISFDCDGDALRFCVRQKGNPPAFCHLGSRSCWGNDSGLPALFQTLIDRKANAPEGSYTRKLFQDRTLLRNKLLEEAQEVCEAVEEADPVHVAEEAADLLYFLCTACVAGEITLEDICRVLDTRALKVNRRPGNAKSYRIDAAERALGLKK